MSWTRIAGLMLVVGAVGCGADMQRSAPDEASMASFRATPESDMKDAVGVAARTVAAEGKEPTASFQPDRLPTQMIIRTGNVSIEVDSIELAVVQVTQLAAKAGGFVANSSIQTGDNDSRSATIELKIPADRYDGTVDGLRSIGEVKSASTTTQDVGEEFVDVTARVANARKLEERILGLLATRTGKLEDVLNVERELARVREEIERFEGRLRYLKAKVSMSTVVVNVFEPGPLVGSPGENVILDALRQSWRNFVSVIAGAIEVTGGLLPMFALVALVLWVGRRWWKRQQVPPAV